MAKAQLLEDIFEVLEKDPDGKKFDKGARQRHARGHALRAAARQQASTPADNNLLLLLGVRLDGR